MDLRRDRPVRAVMHAAQFRDQEAPPPGRHRVLNHGAGIRLAARSRAQILRASRQTNQPEDRSLHAQRLGWFADTSAHGVYQRGSPFSVRRWRVTSAATLPFASLTLISDPTAAS